MIFCLAAWSQTGTTSLRGTVTDASGAALAGATVTISDPSHGFQRSATTSASGAYEFLQLQPSTYLLAVEMNGFRRYERKDMQLLVDSAGTANVKMEVGAKTEVVEVNAEGATINTSDASLGNAFNELQVRELPIEGRNVPDLLTLQNGVTYTGNRTDINQDSDTRSGAVNGARSDQSNITLDGVDVNDNINGYAFDSVLPVTLDSVEEFRVTTTNYGADEGRSSGAQVSLVTKSGTNNFHGSIYEYLRNTYTSANDYFVKLAELSTNDANVPLQLNYNIFGASAGGPLMKDRLFFFANYEGKREAQQESSVRIVPSDALRDGVMQYLCTLNGDGSLNTAQCPGGPVQGNTQSWTVPAGYYGLTPGNITQMDPLHIGANSVVMNYFNGFPHGNDNSQGDGLDFIGYRFRGSAPSHYNWYIARVDYKLTGNGSHTLFWRGALRNDVVADPPYLPGTSPLQLTTNNSSGFTIGYTAVIRPTLISNFRYGLTRQSFGNPGNTSSPVIFFRGLNDNSTPNNSSLAYIYSRSFTTPLNNFVEDLTWTKGKHTLQFGGNLRFIRNPRTSFLTSYPSGTTNSSGLNTAGIANTNSPLDPSNSIGAPTIDPSFNLLYNYPLIAMMGMVTQINATYNFDKNGNALPLGAPVQRRYAADEYEMYAQDSFRVRPNFTITYGLRYSLFSPPWETSGTQVAPTPGLGGWFSNRWHNMLNGVGSENDPTVSFSLAGAANGKPGFYNWDYHNFAPRLSFAYNPRPDSGWLHSLFGADKTVIRGGAGIVYDRIGGGLLQTFDTFGAFGLSTELTNDVIPSASTSPRLSSLTSVPCNEPGTNISLCPAQPSGGFPFVFPAAGTGLAIYYGMDNSIKTPYAYTMNLTIGRQLGQDLTLEVSYVGRLSRRLLSQEDMAMPLDIVDKQSGVSYFAAARQMSAVGRSGVPTSGVNASVIGPTAKYWQDMIQPLAPGDQYSLACSGGFTTDPVQAMYDLYSCGGGPVNGFGDETTPLAQLDYWGSDFSGNAGILGQSGNYYTSILGPNSFFNKQFHALFAWRSIGNANYNAGQVTLRHNMRHGLQFDVNYTYSKSFDISSDATRVTFNGGLSSGLGGIINSWNPNEQRGLSDFDTTHQFNTNWVFQLPFGRGKRFAGTSGGLADAVIGGWELSGIARWTSGFPVNIANGATWPTNWQLPGNADVTGHPVAGTTKFPAANGNSAYVDLFPDPQGPTGIGAFGNAYPGESGPRNQVLGQGYASFDAGLNKSWRMPYNDGHSLKFRWDVFNIPNLNRFDVASITNSIDQGPAFGKYSGLLTNPRVMQFALRYEF